jgi:integrase
MSSSIREAYNVYCRAHTGVKTQLTLNHTGTAITILEQFLSETGRSTRMCDFSVQDAEAWRGWMIGLGRHQNSTINSYLRSTAPFFRWASRGPNRAIEVNPFAGIKPLDEEHEVMEYTRNEIQAMIDVADTRWQGMIILAVSSSMERGAILNLTWRDVVRAENRVWVRKKKQDDAYGGTWEWAPKRRGKERRAVQLPMSPKMDAVLGQLESDKHLSNPYIFVPFERYWDLRQQGELSEAQRNCPITSFNVTFDKLLKAAGVPKVVRGNRRKFHTLRATGITAWSRIPGLAPQDVQALARHSDLKTTTRYMAINPAAAQVAAENAVI